jgi:phage-related protein
MNVLYYKTASGREPVREYVGGLPMEDQASILADIKLINQFGVFDAPIVTRKLQGKLWEIKTGTRHQQRIFYCIITEVDAIFLHACKKQKEGAQRDDVKLAFKRMKELLS